MNNLPYDLPKDNRLTRMRKRLQGLQRVAAAPAALSTDSLCPLPPDRPSSQSWRRAKDLIRLIELASTTPPVRTREPLGSHSGRRSPALASGRTLKI